MDKNAAGAVPVVIKLDSVKEYNGLAFSGQWHNTPWRKPSALVNWVEYSPLPILFY